MVQNIFISYSSNDQEKVVLISGELATDPNVFPIIIASERESLKPLAAKVADGIRKADIVVPLLTTNSMNTQWINQEIGFAQALEKRIMPIVEIGIIGSLKGFIHKEVQLPYLFAPSSNKAKEHKDFLKQFRLLLADIKQPETIKSVQPSPPIEKTELERTLEEASKVRDYQVFARQKDDFLRSPEGFPAAESEFKRMIETAVSKLETIQKGGITLSHEIEDNQHTLVIRAPGFTLTLHVEKVGMFVNEQEITLFIKRWRGNLNRQGFYPFEEFKPALIAEQRFKFDVDEGYSPFWLEKNTQYSSEDLVESSLTWLLKEIVSAQKRGT